jgi:hypothetical protein
MYPPDTKAFLYYSIPPEKPRISGELRLRVTSSDDVASSFESGSDLLLTNGWAWARPLSVLSSGSYYSHLYAKLREDQLVPDDLDAVLSTLPLKGVGVRYCRSQLLYTLHDTFIIDFSNIASYFSVITEQGTMGKLPFEKIFFDNREMHMCTPYTGAYTNCYSNIDYSHKSIGSALARFERSTLPDHKGTRTIVLRFLKIITPVKPTIHSYDDHVCFPKEGEFYQRRGRGNKLCKPWSVNIDKSNATMLRGFRLLWDT